MQELRVAEELLEERRGKEEAKTVEPRDLPSADLAWSGEEHLARLDLVPMAVEPEPSASTSDQRDVIEGEPVRLRMDEGRHLVDPRDVDQDLTAVLGAVKVDPAGGRAHARKVP